MKMFCVLVLNLCVIFYARAGGDVPWPVTSQEAVRISDLTGPWVSVNLKDPGYLYFFSFQRRLININIWINNKLIEI